MTLGQDGEAQPGLEGPGASTPPRAGGARPASPYPGPSPCTSPWHAPMSTLQGPGRVADCRERGVRCPRALPHRPSTHVWGARHLCSPQGDAPQLSPTVCCLSLPGEPSWLTGGGQPILNYQEASKDHRRSWKRQTFRVSSGKTWLRAGPGWTPTPIPALTPAVRGARDKAGGATAGASIFLGARTESTKSFHPRVTVNTSVIFKTRLIVIEPCGHGAVTSPESWWHSPGGLRELPWPFQKGAQGVV